MRFGQYTIAVPLDSLYIANVGFWERWGIFPIKLTLTQSFVPQNVWIYLLYTSLNFGNSNYLGILGCLNLILIIISFIAMIKCIKANNANLNILLGTYITQIIAYIIYNIRNPYYCTTNSRYILIAIFLGLIFVRKIL